MTNPIIEKLQQVLNEERLRIEPIVYSQAKQWKIDLVNLVAKILKVDFVRDIRVEQLPPLQHDTNPKTMAKPSKTKTKTKRK